jgi:predicted nucleic acid-binding protein
LRSISELDAALRRIKPEKRRVPLHRRDRLNFVPDDVVPARIGPVLLDTCVYLDAGKGKLPRGVRRLLADAPLFHCGISLSEMAYAFGRLDSRRPVTADALDFLRAALDRVRADRTLVPDGAAYVEAGIITGTPVRTQSLGRPERRKLLLDVLLFLTARRSGYPVLTANTNDFDLIQQLVPSGKVIYYAPVAPAPRTAA